MFMIKIMNIINCAQEMIDLYLTNSTYSSLFAFYLRHEGYKYKYYKKIYDENIKFKMSSLQTRSLWY